MAKRHNVIRAGRLCYESLCTPPTPRDTGQARAEKRKATTAYREAMNLRKSWQKLELLIAANFGPGDLVLTLTYRDADLPACRRAALKLLRKFIGELRTYRRARGQELLYIYCTEDKHGDGRVHHHLVINGTGDDVDVIRSLWIWGDQIRIKPLDIYRYEALARYLTKEPREYGKTESGVRTWVPSINLRRPAPDPPEWVPDSMTLTAPPGAVELNRNAWTTEYGSFAFIKYLLPRRPDDGRPRARRRKKKK